MKLVIRHWFALVLTGALGFGVSAAELEHRASRELVDLVTRATALVGEQGAAACDAFKQEGGEWLHGETYVFILDIEGNALCHPGRPGLEGRNLSEFRDPDGKPIMELIRRELERGASDGWVHYLWPRPGESSVMTWKSTYVHEVRAPDGDALVVGAGAYQLPMERRFIVDRVEAAVELLEARGRAAFDVLRDRASGFIFYDAYVFVLSTTGMMLVNPAFPDMEGSPALDIEDFDGVRPGRAMLELLASRDEGWVSYLWPRPGIEEVSRKEAFVKKVRVGEEELVVGAGVYFDD